MLDWVVNVSINRRIVLRDIKERGRTAESVLHQYNSFSRKVFNEFVSPSMKYADIIIPYGRPNDIAVDFLVETIKKKIKEMGLIKKVPLTVIYPENIMPSDNGKEINKKSIMIDHKNSQSMYKSS